LHRLSLPEIIFFASRWNFFYDLRIIGSSGNTDQQAPLTFVFFFYGVSLIMMRGRVISTLLIVLMLSHSGCDDAMKVAKPHPAPSAPGPVDADAPEEFTTTESGLKYRIRRASNGKKPTVNSLVTINLRGTLDDGDIFETTYGSGGTPDLFQVNDMLPGVREGLLLTGEGAMIELEVPPDLAFGKRGYENFAPPDATLHYLIELITVGREEPTRDVSVDVDNPTENMIAQPLPEAKSGEVPIGKQDDDAPTEFTLRTSGLKYRILRNSDGEKPNRYSNVKVHYRGWLDNGVVFDESYKRGEPVELPLQRVIPGWTEGLQLVGKGGMIELEIPAELGYGKEGKGKDIPGGATLHFVVELLNIR